MAYYLPCDLSDMSLKNIGYKSPGPLCIPGVLIAEC